jgi:hypothetical protein
MELLEFRKIRLSDLCDKKYTAWSRIYEYPIVLDIIKKHNTVNHPKIHNTCWGWGGCHTMFKNNLDAISDNCIHSDLKESNLPKTIIWDVTSEPTKEFKNNFNIVINVSTMEEVNFDHLKIFNNLLSQVCDGGLLICTFDLPGLQLEKFESLFNKKIDRFDDEISGDTSKLPNDRYKHLSCGLIVIKK